MLVALQTIASTNLRLRRRIKFLVFTDDVTQLVEESISKLSWYMYRCTLYSIRCDIILYNKDDARPCQIQFCREACRACVNHSMSIMIVDVVGRGVNSRQRHCFFQSGSLLKNVLSKIHNEKLH